MSRSTIVDVAKKADVSTATVSRVINNNYPVSAETRAKVECAMNELDFRLNRHAHNLKSNSSHMIGIIVADISNPYFMKIAKGIENVVGELGYTMVCASSDESFEKEINVLETFIQYRIDGVVLASCGENVNELNKIMDQRLPSVMVDSMLFGVHADVIAENGREAARELTEYVLNMNHKRVCMVNGDIHRYTGYIRYQGYCDALKKYNVDLKEEYVINGLFDRDTAAKAFAEVLDSPNIEKPTAVICASNMMAEGVLSEIVSRGMRIPDDISIVSYNELSYNNLLSPKITHLTDNTNKIGNIAGKMLIERLNNKDSKSSVIDKYAYKTLYLDKKLIKCESVKKMDNN